METPFSNPADYFKKLSETVYLFKKIWKENSIALLSSPLDEDKTEQIIEIVDNVAVDDRKVVYVNTEHRADNFIERFVNNDNLVIFTPTYESAEDTADYAELVFSGIEKAVTEFGVRTFIIDSVSRIAAKSFRKNASPAFIMKRLAALQDRYHLSLLVIAHSSTKSVDRSLKTLSDTEITVPTDPSEKSEPSEKSDMFDSSTPVTTRQNRPSGRLRRKYRSLADNQSVTSSMPEKPNTSYTSDVVRQV